MCHVIPGTYQGVQIVYYIPPKYYPQSTIPHTHKVVHDEILKYIKHFQGFPFAYTTRTHAYMRVREGVHAYARGGTGGRGRVKTFKCPLTNFCNFYNEDYPTIVPKALIARSTSPLIKETTSNNTTMMIFIMVTILLAFNFMTYLSYNIP